MLGQVDNAMFKLESSFDEAILGVWDDRYVYDGEAVLDMLEKFNGWDEETAQDWFEEELQSREVAEGFPIFVVPSIDKEWKAPEPVMPFTPKEIHSFFVKGAMDSGVGEETATRIAGNIYGMYRQVHERYVEAIRLETNRIMAKEQEASDSMLDMMNLLRRLD